jgi:hypothetical protein
MTICIKRRLGLSWGFLLVGWMAWVQTVPLINAGLEAPYQETFRMNGWQIWGDGATPDIQPGQWGVTKAPLQGRSYVGLITREDGTREGMYQALSEPLQAGKCYYLDLALARHPEYAGFRLPLSLRLRGRNGLGGPVIDLALSPLVTHEKWVRYTMEFTLSRNIDQLILEASYAPGCTVPYRGNILIDDLSELKPCLRAERNGGSGIPATFIQ